MEQQPGKQQNTDYGKQWVELLADPDLKEYPIRMDTSVGRGRPGVVIIPGIGSDPATQEQRRQEQLEALAELPAILKEFEAMLDATEKPSKEEFAKQCEQFELMWAAGIPAREARAGTAAAMTRRTVDNKPPKAANQAVEAAEPEAAGDKEEQ